ncbi:hypothetical protein TURU_067744 [Turdus rufiventris]|nr:hypothetical protein TURU_067744 [Turdus rufiventris]
MEPPVVFVFVLIVAGTGRDQAPDDDDDDDDDDDGVVNTSELCLISASSEYPHCSLQRASHHIGHECQHSDVWLGPSQLSAMALTRALEGELAEAFLKLTLCWDMEGAGQAAAGWQERESGWQCLPPRVDTSVVPKKNFKRPVPQLSIVPFLKQADISAEQPWVLHRLMVPVVGTKNNGTSFSSHASDSQLGKSALTEKSLLPEASYWNCNCTWVFEGDRQIKKFYDSLKTEYSFSSFEVKCETPFAFWRYRFHLPQQDLLELMCQISQMSQQKIRSFKQTTFVPLTPCAITVVPNETEKRLQKSVSFDWHGLCSGALG